MIGVEMGYEYMVDAQIIDADLAQLPCSAATAIEQNFGLRKLECIAGRASSYVGYTGSGAQYMYFHRISASRETSARFGKGK